MNADRVELCEKPLDIGGLYEWALTPSCGAVVVFSGTVRDHADGREGVTALVYEAYREPAEQAMRDIITEARRRQPSLGRIALTHRVGELQLTESSVVVVVSAPHRPEAFEAARFCIDALKQSVPIWKKERWSGGEDWGTRASSLVSPQEVASGDGRSHHAAAMRGTAQ
ncbi:MAG: molybdenum cofactor biosynthesis protein MoaE [Actinobacteria bacterium]|nr:molybdenum cofactor biosynthesis protein MoaE [Actinomycetota bacterium]NBO32891.1 molybdenum cofactor biosynthesis protein MoaE [Actinomycetota bacterium]